MFFNNRFVNTVVREHFGKAVNRGLMGLQIKKPTHSPINGLIENAVIEVCVLERVRFTSVL